MYIQFSLLATSKTVSCCDFSTERRKLPEIYFIFLLFIIIFIGVSVTFISFCLLYFSLKKIGFLVDEMRIESRNTAIPPHHYWRFFVVVFSFDRKTHLMLWSFQHAFNQSINLYIQNQRRNCNHVHFKWMTLQKRSISKWIFFFISFGWILVSDFVCWLNRFVSFKIIKWNFLVIHIDSFVRATN